MFKLFKKPPEIPEELDYLAEDPSHSASVPNFSDENKETPVGVTAKRAAKEEKEEEESSDKSVWPRVLLGGVVCLGLAAGVYWGLTVINAPVPAEIPSGDILASLTSNPSAAPPGNTPPAPPQQNQAQQPPKPAPAPPAAPPSGSSAPAQPAKPQQPPQPQQPANPSNPAPQPEAKQEPTQDIMSGIFGSNPFVDLSSLRGLVTASNSAGNLPTFGGNGNMALPDIPRPEVSPDLLPSPGEIRTPPGPAGMSGGEQPPTMGGLIRSSDGHTIAIMGDGAVLSEGDTYKGDRRVTFIGGEGITFDDGNSISFGGQNK